MATKRGREQSSDSQKRSRRENRRKLNVADWGSQDAKRVLRVIAAVSKVGAAIRFGYTRDGGVYALGIVGDGDAYTEYVRPDEDMDLFLDGLAEDFEAPGGG
jgi:hypothetical protein